MLMALLHVTLYCMRCASSKLPSEEDFWRKKKAKSALFSVNSLFLEGGGLCWHRHWWKGRRCIGHGGAWCGSSWK